MRGSEHLHRLIHALTPSEKRYFRVQVSNSSSKDTTNYLKLFDALLKQENYDQQALLQRFEGEGWTRRFSAEKNYLYQLILKTMRNYVAERDIFTRIRGQLQDIGYLYEKMLYVECRKVLDKTKKQALKFEDFASLIDLLLWERKLLKRETGKDAAVRLEELIVEKDLQLAKLTQQMAYSDLYDRLFLLTRKDQYLRESASLAEVNALMKDPLMQSPHHTISFQARHFYYQIKAFYDQLTAKHTQAMQHYAALVAHWEAQPFRIQEEPGKFSVILANYLAYCLLASDYADFPQVLERMRSIPARTTHEESRARQNVYYYELQYLLYTGQLDAGKVAVSEIRTWLEKEGDLVGNSRKLSFYHNCTVLLFVSGDYREALFWVNKILNHVGEAVRKDALQSARMLWMAIHFELGNYEIVLNMARSARRYYQKQDRLFDFEKMFLRSMKKLVNRREDEQMEIMAELKKALAPHLSGTRAWPGAEAFSIWLDSKLENKSIRQLALQWLGQPAR